MEENQTIDRRNCEDQSQSIAKIAKALSMAQKEISGATTNSKNPFFKSNYADLFSVIESCREVLSKNEIAFVQGNRFKGGVFFVVTKLIHTSGEWLSSELALPMPKGATAQAIGSLNTYGRRYGLASIVGIAQKDDDANAASHQNKVNKQGGK